jgi:hypothetical protein
MEELLMSLRDWARSEMEIVNMGDEDQRALVQILDVFFGMWNSGGAVAAMAPVLNRLIAGKPLSPIADEPDQWDMVDPAMYQHRRLSSVFKTTGYRERAYDVDAADPHVSITFPYFPEEARVRWPVFEVDTKEPS